MAHFVLARESRAKKGSTSLPGIPVALVKSDAPSLAGTFLCAVTERNGHGRSAKDDAAAEAAVLAAARQARNDLRYAASAGKDGSAIRALHAGQGAAADASGSFFGPVNPAETRQAKRAQFADRVDPWSEAHHGPLLDQDDADEDDDEEDAPVAAGRPKLPDVPPEPLMALKEASFVKLPPNSWFEPLPLIKTEDRAAKDAYRTTMYVAGRSGSGKSFWSAGVIQRYHKLWPGQPIWGICKTKLADDPAYAGLDIRQLPLNKLKEYAAKQQAKAAKGGGSSGGGASGEVIDVREAFGADGCLILFDDWDSFEADDKKLVLSLIKDVQNLGRKLKISIIVTSHLLTNYNETRGIISEAENITLFPQHTMPQQLTYLCAKLGLPKDVIASLRRKGRWVMIHNAAPLYLLSETECELLAPSEDDIPDTARVDQRAWDGAVAASGAGSKRRRPAKPADDSEGSDADSPYSPYHHLLKRR